MGIIVYNKYLALESVKFTEKQIGSGKFFQLTLVLNWVFDLSNGACELRKCVGKTIMPYSHIGSLSLNIRRIFCINLH